MPNNPSLTPPPLIPISMLGAQNAKSKHQTNSTPPKLQRIPKSDADAQIRNSSKITKIPSTNSSLSNIDKKESTWFPQTENEFLQSHDGIIPKPAQNIALMGGKRYIVVPKNNAMAVQPAITVRPDKIGDKPPMLQDGSLTDISNTVDNSSITKLRAPSSKQLNIDLPEKVNVTSNKDISKDTAQLTDLASSVTSEITETLDNKNNKDSNKDIPKEDKAVEKILENKSLIADIDYVPEKKKADIDRRLSENKSVRTPVHTTDTTDTLEAKSEPIKAARRQSLSSKVGTVTKIKNSK